MWLFQACGTSNILLRVVLNHHSSPAVDTFLVQHVLHGLPAVPGGGQGSLPFAIREVLVNDYALEHLDVVQ